MLYSPLPPCGFLGLNSPWGSASNIFFYSPSCLAYLSPHFSSMSLIYLHLIMGSLQSNKEKCVCFLTYFFVTFICRPVIASRKTFPLWVIILGVLGVLAVLGVTIGLLVHFLAVGLYTFVFISFCCVFILISVKYKEAIATHELSPSIGALGTLGPAREHH